MGCAVATLEPIPQPRVPCVAAPDGQRQGATTTAYPLWYVEEEQRRSWPPAAATKRFTDGLGRSGVAAPRCSSFAYWPPVRRTPRALRGLQLGPAQGTGG